MTVTALPVRDEFTATAGQTVFNYTFLIFTANDLNVYITPSGQEANDSTDLTTAYTVDVGTIGNPLGGFITLNSGVSSGDLVTIVSNIVEDRTTDYQNSGDFLPDTVNEDFDRTVSLSKQATDRAARTLAFQESLQNATALTLPNPSATKFLRWLPDESGLENIDLTSLGTPTDSSVINYNAGNNWAGGAVRTVENKFQDLPTPLDFGAVGNGVTNDSAAFTALEAAIRHRGIDLQGLTYVVTTAPEGNLYFNGYFSVSADVRRKSLPVNAMATPMVESFDETASLLYHFTNFLGPGGNTIGIQSFAFSERERRLYTLNLNGAGSGDKSTVNRFDTDGDIEQDSLGHSDPEGEIAGHQGLAIESTTSTVKLWSTSFADKLQAVRYDYVDNNPLANPEIFTLFDSADFETTTSCTPCISYGNKYLLAYGTKTGDTQTTVRVWELSTLLQGGAGDHSDNYLFEWATGDLVDSTHPTQGIACDGTYVWLLAGNGDIAETKRIYTWSLYGDLIDASVITIGRAQALLDGGGTVYEPEGLSLFKNAAGGLMLCVGIISGDLGTRFVRVYGIGLDNPVVCDEINIVGNTKSSIVNSETAGRDFLGIRARLDGTTGAGINLYGEDDASLANMVGFLAGGDAAAVMTIDRSTNNAVIGTPDGSIAFDQNTVPTVSGSRGGNAALTSLLSVLDTMGLINDTTT